MKKLILLLALAFVMYGRGNQYVTDFGIVEGVEINNGEYSSKGKYIVTMSEDFNAHWKRNAYLYTDELYKVGDTIQTTKKSRLKED